jgi:hypothetical protein
LAAASHDLRQLLYALQLFISVLDKLTMEQESRHVFGKITRSADALNNLLNSLLDISPLDAVTLNTEPSDFLYCLILGAEFHQLGNPERDRSYGLGLGLSIVKRAAVLVGLEITVHSASNVGSTFSTTIPKAQVSILAAAPRMPDAIIADYRLRDNATSVAIIGAINAHYETKIPSIIITGEMDDRQFGSLAKNEIKLLKKPASPAKHRAFLAAIKPLV